MVHSDSGKEASHFGPREIMDFLSKKLEHTILIVEAGPRHNKIIAWDQTTSSWTVLELPRGDRAGGVVYLNRELYLIAAGRSRRNLLKLDKNMEWKQLADMNLARKSLINSCLEWNGSFWAIGGKDPEENNLKSVERYDPEKDKWTQMSDMKYARADAAAAVCNRKIIVCGGWGDDGYLKSMECFDPEAGIWTELVDMPSPRTDHSLVFYGNTLIIMGGINGEAGAIPVVELDPLEENGQWKELPPTKIRGSLVGIVLGREIFAIDRNSDPGPVHVEIFDGSSWRYGPVLPVEFVLPSVVLIPQDLADQFRNLKMQ